MEYKVDLTKMIASMRNAEDTGLEPEFIETVGELYIYENIIQKDIKDEPIVVRDINFDEFDEDDITELIDNKMPYIEDKLDRIGKVVKVFMKMPAKSLMARKFF